MSKGHVFSSSAEGWWEDCPVENHPFSLGCQVAAERARRCWCGTWPQTRSLFTEKVHFKDCLEVASMWALMNTFHGSFGEKRSNDRPHVSPGGIPSTLMFMGQGSEECENVQMLFLDLFENSHFHFQPLNRSKWILCAIYKVLRGCLARNVDLS